MIQINLTSKKRSEKSGKNWIIISAISVFSAFGLYFLGTTIYVLFNLYSVNNEISKVDTEAETLSAKILANKEELGRFVLTKAILERIDLLKKDRFRYKDYLDQLSKFIPANAVLTNVDFANKGWVTVSVSLPGVTSLGAMESSLRDAGRLAQSEFVSVFAESVTSDKSGTYLAKLFFEIKQNGRK